MSHITEIAKGVCAPKGFFAGGIHCGIRKSKTKKDLAFIYSTVPASAAGAYTKNKVKASPVYLTKSHLENGIAQAVICNSGNANACNADGMEKAIKMAQLTANVLKVKEEDVIVASTGVIGEPLPIEPIAEKVSELASSISDNGSEAAADAIMTTDTAIKQIAISFQIGGTTCHMGAIAKGSGMIHPNMGTMLSFITTDVAISPEMLNKAVKRSVEDTYNMVSVDGDTSTNDMVTVLANGLANNPCIIDENNDFHDFYEALTYVNTYLSKCIAADGEGATKLLECNVFDAPDKNTAKIVAKSVITSSLFKAAMFGEDANWGRILCAVGYADAEFDISKVAVQLTSAAGSIQVCKNGAGLPFSEEKASEILHEKTVIINISLGSGNASATAWGCDLTYDYVKINGDYRT